MEKSAKFGRENREGGFSMITTSTACSKLRDEHDIRIKKAISLKWIIFYFLVLVPFIKPDAISQWSSLAALDFVYRLWKYVSLVGVALLYIFKFKSAKISLFPVLLSCGVIMLGLSTAMHGQNVMLTVINPWIGFIAVSFLFDEAIERKPRELLIATLAILSILILINFYYVLFSPPISIDQETSLHVFLGQKNSVRNYVLPAMCIAFSLSSLNVFWAKAVGIGISIIGIISQIIFYSATGVVVSVLLLICCVFPAVPRLINKMVGLVFPAALYIIVVLARIPIFSDFINSVLHKDMKFTGRSQIWDAAIRGIEESPMFGKGSGDTGLAKAVSEAANSSHNALLDIAYKGGGAALLCFVLLYILSYARLFRAPTSNARSTIIATLLLFIISGIFENLSYIGFFLVLQLAYHAEVFTDKEAEYVD